jgi:PleD family two-component response regulator
VGPLPKKRSAHFALIPGSFPGNSQQERKNTMTDNTLENRIEQLVSREIYLNQSHLVEDLILKPNPDWIEYLLQQGKSPKKVMIVDENAYAVHLLTDVLQARGYQVVEANGPELIQKAIHKKPDIIIINSMLPKNQEALRALRFEKGLKTIKQSQNRPFSHFINLC